MFSPPSTHAFSAVSSESFLAFFSDVSTIEKGTALAAITMRASRAVVSSIGIVIGQFMPIPTVSASCIYSCWTIAAMLISPWRNVLNVSGIYTFPNTAKMIAFTSLRYNMDEHAVSDSVCRVLTVPIPEIAISVSFNSRNPQPTRAPIEHDSGINANLLKESSEELGVYGKSVRIVLGHLSLLNRFIDLGYSGANRCALSF